MRTNHAQTRWSKNVAMTLAGLLTCIAAPRIDSHAATLSPSGDRFLLDDFGLIERAFTISDSFPASVIPTENLTLTDPSKALELTLETTPLPTLDAKNGSGLTFQYAFNRLKELRWDINPGSADVQTLAQTDYQNVYEGVYEFGASQTVKAEQLIGQYLTITASKINSTDLSSSLPNTDVSMRRSGGLGIIGIGRSSSAGLSRTGLGTGGVAASSGRIGIALNRVSVSQADEYDSALQLWPRSPFRMQVGNDGGQTQEALQSINSFGNLKIGVSYPLMPKQILTTSLDTEVNWVDRGQYSKNIRQDTQLILDIQRKSQEQFQARLESQRQKWVASQQRYQRSIQQSVNRGNVGYQTQPKNYQTKPKY